VKATDATGTAAGYAPVAGVVAGAGAALAAARQPMLAGPAGVGARLTVRAGAWSARPAQTTVAWLRCNANGRACAAIAGAAGRSYALTTGDAGHTVVAEVQATGSGGEATVLSVASLPVG
jgi:hypothetical protein